MRFSSLICCLAALFVVSLQNGCGEKSISSVGGTVTHAGKPVANMIVNFLPDKGMRASGMTDSQGKFSLKSPQGMPVGSYKVWVNLPMTSSKDDDQLQKLVEKNRDDPVIQGILERYGSADRPQLTVEVTKNSQAIEIRLD